MKKNYFLFFVLVCLIGVHAQNDPSGKWGIVNGVSVFVETGSELDNIRSGIPDPDPKSFAYRLPGSTFINFDDISSPCNFVQTVPLTNEYALQGVTFSGSGFSLLDQCGNFGVSGYSQPNHVAWNSCCSGLSETMTFTPAISNVSFLAGSDGGATLIAEAFDGANQSLGIVNATLVNVMQTISLPYSGIAKVQISVTNHGIMDDLMFENGSPPSVPLSNWALYLGIFLMVMFTAIRFRKMI
ncbi:MAG: hypothetical protein IH595_01550 [Bacteroidales bacterium]|nr:hypothetical protein [Bacteroidales bacterium]